MTSKRILALLWLLAVILLIGDVMTRRTQAKEQTPANIVAHQLVLVDNQGYMTCKFFSNGDSGLALIDHKGTMRFGLANLSGLPIMQLLDEKQQSVIELDPSPEKSYFGVSAATGRGFIFSANGDGTAQIQANGQNELPRIMALANQNPDFILSDRTGNRTAELTQNGISISRN